MEAKFFLWSKTLWGMGIVNAVIVLWNVFFPHMPVSADQAAAVNMVGTLIFRSITDTPVKLTP